MNVKLFFILSISLFLLIISVTAQSASRPIAATEATGPPIRDLQEIRQDCLIYVDPNASAKPLISADRQKTFYEDFRRRHFAAWDGQNRDGEVILEARRLLDKYGHEVGFGENFRQLEPAWIRRLADQADLDRFPSLSRPAITIRNTNLRDLPTAAPRFNEINKAGEGYPFDSLQNSALWVNTPIYACHATGDGSWVLAWTTLGIGWIPAEDIAFVDDELINTWRGSQLAALVKDNVSVRGAGGELFRFKTHIGAVFPLAGSTKSGHRCLIAIADANRQAVCREAVLSGDDVAVMPLELSAANVARLANCMIGQPYGWGGLYEFRDCSATVRDSFTPFGLFLPRGSNQQATCGLVIPLDAMPAETKERTILEKGVPFLTLIHCPGHVMLYIGRDKSGRALILHNNWGIKVRNADGSEGRNIMGRCAITTLQPGIELPNIILPEGDIRNRIDCMVLLGRTAAEDRP